MFNLIQTIQHLKLFNLPGLALVLALPVVEVSSIGALRERGWGT